MFIAIIGQPVQKSNLINAWCRIIAETKSELKYKLKQLYKNTIWQQKEDTIAVYNLVTESNGYTHTGNELFRINSSRFWSKNIK